MENVLKITLKRYNGNSWDKIYLRTSTDMIEVNVDMTLSDLLEMILSKIDTDGEIISGIISPERLPKATADKEGIVKLGSTEGAANYLHDHDWVDIKNTPTTLDNYGITDAAHKHHYHNAEDINSGVISEDRLPIEYSVNMPVNQYIGGYWLQPIG